MTYRTSTKPGRGDWREMPEPSVFEFWMPPANHPSAQTASVLVDCSQPNPYGEGVERWWRASVALGHPDHRVVAGTHVTRDGAIAEARSQWERQLSNATECLCGQRALFSLDCHAGYVCAACSALEGYKAHRARLAIP